MPISAADIDALPDYTDAQLLKLARSQVTQILATGQAYDMNGRSLTRTDLPKIQEFIEWLEGRIDAEETDEESTSNDGVALAIFRQTL